MQGIAAQRALRLAEAAIQRLGAQVNPKIVLSVFAAKFRALVKNNSPEKLFTAFRGVLLSGNGRGRVADQAVKVKVAVC